MSGSIPNRTKNVKLNLTNVIHILYCSIVFINFTYLKNKLSHAFVK